MICQWFWIRRSATKKQMPPNCQPTIIYIIKIRHSFMHSSSFCNEHKPIQIITTFHVQCFMFFPNVPMVYAYSGIHSHKLCVIYHTRTTGQSDTAIDRHTDESGHRMNHEQCADNSVILLTMYIVHRRSLVFLLAFVFFFFPKAY